MLTPSQVEVPRPISSSSTRLRAVAVCRMALVSDISTMNVDCPRTRLSLAPTRVNTRSAMPTRARVAGTKLPICAIRAMSPICRRIVLLPAMFGPVRMIMRAAAVSDTSFGMNWSRGIMRSTTGCRPPVMSSAKSSLTSGRTYPSRAATSARAASTSSWASVDATCCRRPISAAVFARNSSKRCRSSSSVRSVACSTFSSNSFSAGVTYRSAPVSVCRRW